MNTITLKEWNDATTEQRQAWLDAGTLVRDEDRASLDAQAFPTTGSLRAREAASSGSKPLERIYIRKAYSNPQGGPEFDAP